jgi:hypothetical protein
MGQPTSPFTCMLAVYQYFQERGFPDLGRVFYSKALAVICRQASKAEVYAGLRYALDRIGASAVERQRIDIDLNNITVATVCKEVDDIKAQFDATFKDIFKPQAGAGSGGAAMMFELLADEFGLGDLGGAGAAAGDPVGACIDYFLSLFKPASVATVYSRKDEDAFLKKLAGMYDFLKNSRLRNLLNTPGALSFFFKADQETINMMRAPIMSFMLCDGVFPRFTFDEISTHFVPCVDAKSFSYGGDFYQGEIVTVFKKSAKDINDSVALKRALVGFFAKLKLKQYTVDNFFYFLRSCVWYINSPAHGRDFLDVVLSNCSWVSFEKKILLWNKEVRPPGEPDTLESMVAAFGTESEAVSRHAMVKPERLMRAEKIYRYMENVEKRYDLNEISSLDLNMFIRLDQMILRDSAQSARSHDRSMASMLAVLREYVRRHLRVFPYGLQMFNDILLLTAPTQRCLAQIKTGEGKSVVLAILIAYKALTTDRIIFMVTSSEELARRDSEQFKSFFKDLGIACTDNVGKKHLNPDTYKKGPRVVYTTNHLLATALLTAQNRTSPLHAINFRLSIKILDEVDAMFFDRKGDSSQLTSSQNDCLVCEPVITKLWNVYQWVWTFISDNPTGTYEAFVEFLRAKNKLPWIGEEVNKPKLMGWYHSAKRIYGMKKNVDYIVRENPLNGERSIGIVDLHNTAEIREKSIWGGGLQQLAQVRENFSRVTFPTVTQCSATPADIYNLSESLYAVTGTSGGGGCSPDTIKIVSRNRGLSFSP